MNEISTEVLSPRLIQVSYERVPIDELIHIISSDDLVPVFDYIRSTTSLDYKEYAWVLSLTRVNRLIGISKISEGMHSSVHISRREMLQIALMTNATAIIVVHNHPSGNTEPSTGDRVFTREIMKCLDFHELVLLDHIILTTESHLSMADEGLLPQ